MSLKQSVGALILSLPFAVIFIGATYELGVLRAIGVFVVAGGIVAAVWVGLGLILGGDDS